VKAIRFLAFLLLPMFSGAQPVVPKQISKEPLPKLIVFLSVDCPISQKYIPKLNAIFSRYYGKIKMYGVFAGAIDKKEITNFTKEYQIGFPIVYDKKYRWVHELHGTVTPEVFLFDELNFVRYEGAIDNWFYELGRYRSEPTENYLTAALESVLLHEDLKIKKTEALGCPIQTSKKSRNKR
jgi:hypothetical protein